MKFSSTRSAGASHTFEEVVMKGLADDGGLFVPAEIPQLAVGDLFNEDGTALTFQDVRSHFSDIPTIRRCSSKLFLCLFPRKRFHGKHSKKSFMTVTQSLEFPLLSCWNLLEIFTF